MLRGGNSALRIEAGIWSGLKRKETYCNLCRMEEVEDEEHFMLRCEVWKQEKDMVIESVGDLVREFGMTYDNRKVTLLQTVDDFRIASS